MGDLPNRGRDRNHRESDEPSQFRKRGCPNTRCDSFLIPLNGVPTLGGLKQTGRCRYEDYLMSLMAIGVFLGIPLVIAVLLYTIEHVMFPRWRQRDYEEDES